MYMRRCIVLGGGGFIGNQLAMRLKNEGNFVVGVDIKYPEFEKFHGDEFYIGDLRCNDVAFTYLNGQYDEVYQLAADMGGAGYVFIGEHDEEIITNNAQINLNVARYAHLAGRIFFSSSACVYSPECRFYEDFKEINAYPANPDSCYGLEKLFSERVYLALKNTDVRIARFHNIFGPEGTWNGGREKAPAAICRKVAMAKDGDIIDVWGNGRQERSYLYIDDCIDGILTVMRSDFTGPFNIGSEVAISVDDLVKLVAGIAGKDIKINHIDGPTGVNRRVSNNELVTSTIGWKPKIELADGLKRTYEWINRMVKEDKND